MNKPYHIVTRAARESASIIEQFCQANGQILLPIVNMIQSASQAVDTVIHEVGVKTVEMILVLSAEKWPDRGRPARPAGRSAGTAPSPAASNWRIACSGWIARGCGIRAKGR